MESKLALEHARQRWKQQQIQGFHMPENADPLMMALRYSEMLQEGSLFKFEVGQSDYGHITPKRLFLSASEEPDQNISNLTALISGSNDIPELIRRVKSHATPFEIQVQAAMTISMELATTLSSEPDDYLTSLIEQNSSHIISSLSTAVVTALDTDDGEIVHSLCRLAISPHFAYKMIKRRCTLLALAKHMDHFNPIAREAVLLACNQILMEQKCQSLLASGNPENVEILKEGLVEAARYEINPRFQLLVLSALSRLVEITGVTTAVLDIFHSYAYYGTSDAVSIDAAVGLAEAIKINTDTQQKYLWNVADFTTFPFPKVRKQALKTIAFVSQSPGGTMRLLTETELVENASLVFQHGSQSDCEAMLDVIRQIARSSLYHEYLLSDSDLLSSIVNLVVGCTENETSRRSKRYAEEILLKFHNVLWWTIHRD